MRKKRARTEAPRRLFGRIATQPGKFGGRPFILGRSVELAAVLDMLHEDRSDGEISRRLRIAPEDIGLCRAWQVRFEPERLCACFSRLADPRNFFMLDENCSEAMLYDMARLFGRSSHVRAEGLTGTRNDDFACVWAHVLDKGYRAFLTADTDFKGIARRHRESMISGYGSVADCPEPVPVVIFYNNQNTLGAVVRMLEINQEAILRLADEKDAAYATLTRAGLVKCAADRAAIPGIGAVRV